MTPRRPIALAAAAVVVISAACTDTSRLDLDDVAVPEVTTTTAAPAPPSADGCGGLPAIASYPPLNPMPPAGTVPAGSTMAEIRERRALRVGVSADTLLFGVQNPLTGRIEGFDIDMLRLVARAIFGPGGDDKLEFKVITYAQRIPSLEDRSVDLVAHTMTINCTRWSRVGFSTVYYDAGQKILVRSDSKVASISELQENRSQICAPAGSTNIDELANYPGLQVTAVDDITDCLVLFQQGKVEAITADDTVLAGFADQDPYAKVVGDAFTSEPYGIAANKDDVDLIRFVNGVLATARADGEWKAIYERWLGEFGATPEPPVADTSRPLG